LSLSRRAPDTLAGSCHREQVQQHHSIVFCRDILIRILGDKMDKCEQTSADHIS
jgi:hypothetical protein